jgi:type IV pilus assembly protein PilO
MRFGARELIFLAVMIGLLGSSYFFVFARANSTRLIKEQELAAKQKSLMELSQSTAGIEDLKGRIVELQRAIEYFDSKLPQERDFDSILRELSELAQRNSLATKTVRTLKSVRDAAYSEQPIQMSMTGSFEGFYQFLLELEKLPRITRVTQMNLQKINDREGQMTATLTVSIFFEPDPSAAQRVAGAE